MKGILIPLLALNLTSSPVKVTGTTEYIRQTDQSLITTINLDYKIKLFEPADKTHMWFVGGTVVNDYDHFGKTLKVNVFTTFGLEF